MLGYIPVGACFGDFEGTLIAKKRRIVITTTQSLLNLKSNTMKNTVQKYFFFLILPNKNAEKHVFEHIFLHFVR